VAETMTEAAFIRMYNIQNDSHRLNLTSLARINLNEKELKTFELQEDDVLISRVNSFELVGKCAWVSKEAAGYVFENMLIRLRFKDSIDPLFVSLQIGTQAVRQQIQGFAKKASGQASINSSDIQNIEIILPPLEEQRRIAAISRKCDRLRRTRRFTQQLSDTYLQSVFLRMFGDLEVNTRQWEFKDLESISDIASGITKGQKFNGKMTVSIPYLRVANVQDGYLDLSKIKLIETLASVVEDLKLQFDDVLMTEGGDFDKLGRGAIWKGQIRICVHQNHIFRGDCKLVCVRGQKKI
jgi:type I restriction enzyme S subunit